MDNANRNKANVVLYIVLTLIIVAVVCMTVVGITTGGKKQNELPKITVAPDTAKRPEQTLENLPNVTEKNDQTEFEDGEDAISEPEEPAEKVDAPVKLNIINPVDGYLMKGHDIDMPVYSLTMNDYRVHAGIDILAEPGAPVAAIAEGTVEHVYDDPMMGNCISITHPNGLVSYYKGLSDEVCEGIEEGALVYCGQIISSVGDSTLIELAEESHLHFEMKKDGYYVDPCEYVSYKTTSSDNAEDKGYEG